MRYKFIILILLLIPFVAQAGVLQDILDYFSAPRLGETIYTIPQWLRGNGFIYPRTTSSQVVVGSNATTTTSTLNVIGSISVSGLTNCNTIDTNTGGFFFCGTDEGGAGGITSLNGLTTSTQTFATSTASGVWTISSSGSTHTFTIPSNVGFFSNDANYLQNALTSLNGQTGASQTFASSSAGTDFSISSSGNVHTFYLPSATSNARGLLTAADWTIFNNKVGTSRTISAGFALTGGGDLSADRTISFAGAFATSGASGISIASSSGTWTWSQATSSASASGYLSSADWSTFNSKVGTTRQILTTSPLQGGGDLSADRTISIINPSAQGQLLIASGTTQWVVGSLVAGSNITITTSTPGQITIESTDGGITTLNTLTASTQTFSDVDDTNVTLAISTTSASNHQWALGWTGQLAVGRGGTGLASLTQGYIPFGKGTAAFGSSANLFWDETNSRLGIGTTGPGSMLDVRGGVEFNRTGAATVGDFSVSGDTAPNMYFGRLSPTTGDSTTFYFRSRLNQNKFRVNTAGSGNVSMNFETGGGGAFVIYGSTADSSERFRVTETGNVGIGTTSPGTARLYVSGGRIVADTNIEGAKSYTPHIRTQDSGSASLPVYSFVDDSNTGMWRPGVDTLAFTTGGSQRLTIDNTGNVGIGTTGPGAKLDVFGSSGDVMARIGDTDAGNGRLKFGWENSVPRARITSWSNAGYKPMSIEGSVIALQESQGNVGIGTTTPSSLLHIWGSTPSIRLDNSAAGGLRLAFRNSVLGTNIFDIQDVASSTTILSVEKGQTIVATSSKSVFVESPTASENVTLFSTDRALTIKKIGCINGPTAGNMVTFNIRHNTDRSVTATTSDLFTSFQTCTATTSVAYFSSGINDATVAANESLWLVTSAASSTNVNLTIYFTYDAF